MVPARGHQTKALFHASSDDGMRFTPRQRIPTDGVPNHPQVVVSRDGALVVAWDESGDGSRRLGAARGTPDADGQVRFGRVRIDTAERAVYPVLAATPEGVIIAWTSGTPADSTPSTIKVARLP